MKPQARKWPAVSIVLMIMAGLALAMGISAPAQATDSTVVDVPAIPSGVTYEDPCGPNNAYWTGIPADADTDMFDFHFDASDPMHLVVDISQMGYTFPDGTTTHDYGLPTDSGEACAPETEVIDIPAAPSVDDPCGPNNATWNVPADTDTLDWALNGDDELVVSIKTDNTEFTDGETSHNYGTAPDSGEACRNGGEDTDYATVTGHEALSEDGNHAAH